VRDATLQLDQLNGTARNLEALACEYGEAFGRRGRPRCGRRRRLIAFQIDEPIHRALELQIAGRATSTETWNVWATKFAVAVQPGRKSNSFQTRDAGGDGVECTCKADSLTA